MVARQGAHDHVDVGHRAVGAHPTRGPIEFDDLAEYDFETGAGLERPGLTARRAPSGFDGGGQATAGGRDLTDVMPIAGRCASRCRGGRAVSGEALDLGEPLCQAAAAASGRSGAWPVTVRSGDTVP
ncbi:hypothetical protein [Nocardia fusca]|uniref:hypothetical protein n=1 Tax=Nocardia fusca TaxID=941183 RepID=UPI0007A76873|nr:hypothetical protein [Nocardia fusca]